MDKVQGTYSATLFESTSNGFKVCRFKENKVNEKSLTITGYFPPLEPDPLYELEGDYIEHPRFGMQFSVHSIRKLLPQDRDMVIRFLSGPLFPGIGEKLATEIIDVYGDDILVKLKADPMMPLHLKRLTPKKKEALILGLTQNGDLDEAIEFFTLHGLSIRTIMKIEKIYGSKALQLIQDNPYRMIDDIDGIGFKSADKLAVSMGYEKDHPLRLQAILVSLVMQLCMSSGDTYITEAALFNAVQGTYTFNETDFEETLNTVVFDGRLSREDTRIYHHSQYMSEVFIAEFFKYFPLSHLNPIDPKEVSEALVAIQNHLNIQYDTIQTESIQTFFSQDVSLITGGPGTGKTTIVLGIIELIRFFSPGSSVLLCAPTGRAAKRLKEITQVDAQTIHSALKWDLETNTFGCNQEDPLAYDILILDEFSMVDNWLMANLLKASASIKKILFIGDKDQLPSVSPGFVIRDFLDSRFFATTELQHIYRQKEGSEVIEVAQAMNHGSFNTTNFNKDVKFYHSSPSQVKTYIIQLIANALDKGYTLNDIQVLVPQYDFTLTNSLVTNFHLPKTSLMIMYSTGTSDLLKK